MSSTTLRDAERALLARRHAQTGSHTLGDEADHALLQALGALPSSLAHAARDSGRALGAHVYARRHVEDDLADAIALLSASIAASGGGALHLADAFHRTASLRFEARGDLERAEPGVREAFIVGVLEGYLGAVFNCDATASAEEALIRVRLGAGRDVNEEGARRAGSAA